MSPTRLMTYGVYALGALMVAVGLFFVDHGVQIVRMELGWTQIMGGSVAASAGCVVFVLGLVLHHLDVMRETMERLTFPLPAVPPLASARAPTFAPESRPTADLRPIHPLAPAAKRDRPFADIEEVRPEPALTAALHPAEPSIDHDEVHAPFEPPQPEPILVQSAPALVLAEREEVSQGPAVAAPDAVADPLADAPAMPRANFLSSFLSRRATGPHAPAPSVERPAAPFNFENGVSSPGSHPLIPSRRTSIDLSSGWGEATEPDRPATPEPEPADDHDGGTATAPDVEQDAEPVEASAPVPEPQTPFDQAADAAPDPLQPVVVGRYNAGAASYVMYSNGMIEVETEEGTHQFASMQDLKTFIERRDAKVS